MALGPKDRLSLRINAEVVKCAKIKALANDTTITDVITKALMEYIKEPAILKRK